MKDVSRREFLKTLCLGITVAALQNLPMTTAFADSAISKTKIISKSDRENLVATVARTVQVSYKIDKNTIIEVTRFTDIDGQNVTLNRSVKEDGTGEECIRLKDFLDAEPSCFKNAEKLLDEVYDAKTERDIERLRKKFNDLHNKYGSAREHDYLGQNGFY